MRPCRLAFLPLIIVASGALATPGDDTTFTYQGDLKENDQPASGVFDMTFSLWDAVSAGNQIGLPQIVDDVSITEGRFTVRLDFGAIAFDNSERWLEVVVDATTLSPRQAITRAPYSIQTRGIFVDDAGKVGIGTSAPASKVDLVAVAEQDAGETVLQCGVSDAPGDFLRVGNSTGNNDQFIPLIWGHHQTDDREVMEIIASTDPSQDVGSRAMMTFSASQSDGSVFGGPIVNRPLFQWLNAGDPLMTIAADGRVGIGTTSPQATLNLDLPANSNEGIFLSKAGTSHGSSMTVTGSNNQIFRINVDPNDVSGYEQFEITYNGTAVFTIDRDGEIVTPLTTRVSDPTAIEGVTDYFLGKGVFGLATSTLESGNPIGVKGQTDGRFGTGVVGVATADTGVNHGVAGQSRSTNGYDFYAFGPGVNYGASSSRRWKSNIEPIDDPLGKLASLRGVYFDWDQEHGGHHDVGMIAEEVGEVLPEIVAYEENGIDADGMDYSKLTPLLVEAVNALRIEQETRLTSLRAEKDAEITALTRRVESLETLVRRLAGESAMTE